MNRSRFATSTADLTPEWATQTLAESGVLATGRVTDVDAHPVGEQGQTSQVVRLTLAYEGATDGVPRSLIAKLPSAHAEVHATQNALGSYAREVGFYRDLGARAGVSVPTCFAAEFDPASGAFVLLLEDMSACRVGDLWVSDIDDIRLAVDHMARFHARWWCSAELKTYAWLPQHDDARYHALLGGAYKGALPVTLARYGNYFTPELRALAERLAERWAGWVAHREGEPFALVHNDFHPKQLFFPTDAGGRFAVFDWQSVCAGRPTYDLARLLLKGLRPAELRAHAPDLLTAYRRELASHGVEIALAAVEAEWRSSLLHSLAYTVFVLARTEVSELDQAAAARGVDYRARLITDLAQSLGDHGAEDALG